MILGTEVEVHLVTFDGGGEEAVEEGNDVIVDLLLSEGGHELRDGPGLGRLVKLAAAAGPCERDEERDHQGGLGPGRGGERRECAARGVCQKSVLHLVLLLVAQRGEEHAQARGGEHQRQVRCAQVRRDGEKAEQAEPPGHTHDEKIKQ